MSVKDERHSSSILGVKGHTSRGIYKKQKLTGFLPLQLRAESDQH